MLDQFQWLPFLLAISLLTLSPGVDSLLVMRNASRGGWKDGWVTSLGICSGLFAHAAISAAGVSVILLSSAQWFIALKMAGAAYLCWLGWQSLRNAWHKCPRQPIHTDPVGALRAFRSFQEGLLSNLLNPKAIVFYMAFLPQFIDPAQSTLVQSLFMAGIHFLIGMLWLSFLAIGVSRARSWLSRPRVSRTIDGVSGGLLLFVGVRLGLTQQ